MVITVMVDIVKGMSLKSFSRLIFIIVYLKFFFLPAFSFC